MDASHALDKVTRRSQIGILIFVDKSPITFYSERHDHFETSTFGSEFTATKQVIELLKALFNNIFMFHIPIEAPESVY